MFDNKRQGSFLVLHNVAYKSSIRGSKDAKYYSQYDLGSLHLAQIFLSTLYSVCHNTSSAD